MSAGVQVDQRTVQRFVKGRTTYPEVIAALGQPTSSTIRSDGKQIIMYTYVQMQARPESFIPYVGLFLGGADTRSSSASFIFDRNGVLEDYASSTSQLGAGTGLEAETQFNDRTPNQPRPSSSEAADVARPAPSGIGLGLSGDTLTSSSTAAIYMSDPHGVFVRSVTSGSPAANSSIQPGDIIVTFGGLRVDTIEGLTSIVSTTAVGSVVKIGVIRKGQKLEVAAQL
jgi:membrane-associated protease RseP (regulator of RpoE activity)